MVGGGLPVAEQLNTTSPTSSCLVPGPCTAVFTSDIPWWQNKKHFKGCCHSASCHLNAVVTKISQLKGKSHLFRAYFQNSLTEFTLHCEASLLPFGPIRIHIEGANITAVVFPRHILQNYRCGAERRFCEDHFPLVRLIYLLPKSLVVCCQILNRLVLEMPLPCDLEHTCWQTVILQNVRGSQQ